MAPLDLFLWGLENDEICRVQDIVKPVSYICWKHLEVAFVSGCFPAFSRCCFAVGGWFSLFFQFPSYSLVKEGMKEGRKEGGSEGRKQRKKKGCREGMKEWWRVDHFCTFYVLWGGWRSPNLDLQLNKHHLAWRTSVHYAMFPFGVQTPWGGGGCALTPTLYF